MANVFACPDCQRDTRFTHIKEDGKHYMECRECGGRHLSEKSACIPKVQMADRRTRQLRKKLHCMFDKQWNHPGAGSMRNFGRKLAYEKLAKELGMTVEQCHIGEMDEDDCRRAILVVEGWN